jgi:hypothetical protein
VPPGTVEQENGLVALCDGRGDLVEMSMHGPSIGKGHYEICATAARQAHRSEQVGALIALTGGLECPSVASRPLPDEAVLRADPGLACNQISISLHFGTWAG